MDTTHVQARSPLFDSHRTGNLRRASFMARDVLQRTRHPRRDRRWLPAALDQVSTLSSRVPANRRVENSAFERLPEIPARDGSVGPPHVANLPEPCGIRLLAQAV